MISHGKFSDLVQNQTWVRRSFFCAMPDVSGLESVAEDIPVNAVGSSESNEFTFQPRVSSASSRIANGLGTDFFQRQQRHVEKKLLQQTPNGTSEQPGSKRAKLTSCQNENSEIMKRRPITSEATSMTSRRHQRRKDPPFFDCEASPMPPNSNSLPRSKTFISMTSSKSRKRAVNEQYANMDRLQKAKSKAEKAIKNKKIFSIHGPYPLIRRALRDRGWVEKEFKLPPRKLKEKGDCSDGDDVDDDDDDADDDQKDSGVGASPRPDSEDEDDPDNKYGIMGRMVRNEVPTFQWTTRNSSIDWRFLQKDQVVNHYAKANFTTKVGLCMNLRTLPCFANSNVDSFFPRCFRLSQEEDKLDFIDEFRRVAATSILRIALERSAGDESSRPERQLINESPRVIPQHVLELAIRVCELHAQEREHDDIDLDHAVCETPEHNWDVIIQNYYKLAHEGAIIEMNGSLLKRSESVLDKMKSLNQQYHIDGFMNTWIVKPGAKSRGRGIQVMNKLDDILKLVQCDPTLMKDGRWVIQKYIERPLLLYGTKFDIRQWFLVTDWNPMTIWMYRSSYLRFSTRPFTLSNLEPSVHLCNYSVQKNFEIDSKRHPMLPAENMWSDDDFKRHLQSRGCESLWEDLIYPGMRRAIVQMCQTAQDVVDYRKGSFELYGADFMIDDNYNPWLIEVNSSPTMSRSTAVTSKLCASVQEDTLKVVLDRRKDKNCDLGKFELAFKQPLIDVPLYVGKSLQVEGFGLKRPGGNHTIRRSWTNNPTHQQPLAPRPPASTAQETKPTRVLTQPRPQRAVSRPPLSKCSPLRADRSSSPVKLRMQSTLQRLTNEAKSTPTRQSALNLPRFASNSNLHHNGQQPLSKTMSHGNLSKSINSRSSVGGFHCVSTSHAKAASSMGIMHQGVRNCHHQVVVPKTFPPSLVPGCNVTHQRGLPASGVVAAAPHNIGLALPLQRLLAGDMALASGHKPRHTEIYNYPGQDFRFNGPGRQRVSGIYEWIGNRRELTCADANCEVEHSNDCGVIDRSRGDNNTMFDSSGSSEHSNGMADSGDAKILKEARVSPQFPDLCGASVVRYPFHAKDSLKHPSFANKPKDKADIASTAKWTNSDCSESVSDWTRPPLGLISKAAKPNHLKSLSPPVLRLFSLKQRHEKNIGVAHESFLTVSCPSVANSSNWLSTQR